SRRRLRAKEPGWITKGCAATGGLKKDLPDKFAIHSKCFSSLPPGSHTCALRDGDHWDAEKAKKNLRKTRPPLRSPHDLGCWGSGSRVGSCLYAPLGLLSIL